MHKPAKQFAGVRNDLFHAVFSWMSLEGNRELQLASGNGRYFYSVFARFAISLSAWVELSTLIILVKRIYIFDR
jgi:hypothetical protein